MRRSLITAVAVLVLQATAHADTVVVRKEIGKRKFQYVNVESQSACGEWAVDWLNADGTVNGMMWMKSRDALERYVATSEELSPEWQHSPIYCLATSDPQWLRPVGLEPTGLAAFENARREVMERMQKAVTDLQRFRSIAKGQKPGAVIREYVKLLVDRALAVHDGWKYGGIGLNGQVSLESIVKGIAEAQVELEVKETDAATIYGWTRAGKREGEWRTLYQSNGALGWLHTYSNGVLNGPSLGWHPNGNKGSEGAYVSGSKHGRELQWHENGQRQSDIGFASGQLDGQRTTWHSNGQKESDGLWVGGKPHGKHRWWNEDGEQEGWAEYENGTFVKGTKWYTKFPRPG